jgi:hypothetical protein
MWYIDRGTVNWLIKTARDNNWRTKSSYFDISDLIQEGFLCYYRLATRYPDVLDAPHQMALFKRTYHNRINDLANKRTRSVEEIPLGDLLYYNDCNPTENELATIATLMAQAPLPIKRVLKLLTTEEGCRKLRAAYRLYEGGTRETTNGRLCRLVGADPTKIDLAAEFQQYFSSN